MSHTASLGVPRLSWQQPGCQHLLLVGRRRWPEALAGGACCDGGCGQSRAAPRSAPWAGHGPRPWPKQVARSGGCTPPQETRCHMRAGGWPSPPEEGVREVTQRAGRPSRRWRGAVGFLGPARQARGGGRCSARPRPRVHLAELAAGAAVTSGVLTDLGSRRNTDSFCLCFLRGVVVRSAPSLLIRLAECLPNPGQQPGEAYFWRVFLTYSVLIILP